MKKKKKNQNAEVAASPDNGVQSLDKSFKIDYTTNRKGADEQCLVSFPFLVDQKRLTVRFGKQRRSIFFVFIALLVRNLPASIKCGFRDRDKQSQQADRALPDTSDEVCGGAFSWNWGLVERGQSFYNTSCEMNHKRGGTYGQKTERGRGGAAAPDGGGAPAAGAQAQCGGRPAAGQALWRGGGCLLCRGAGPLP